MRKNVAIRLALVLVFAFALTVRIVGIAPHEDRPDESLFIGPAAKVLSGEIVPGHFFYPPFSHYVNACGYGVLFVGGFVTGAWSGPAEFRAQYFTDDALFVATLRIITALWGALACIFAYAIGRLLGLRPDVALVPAALMALSPVHVLWSHVAKSDIAMTTGLLAFVTACLWVARRPQFWSGSILLGLAAALPLSFKQSAVFYMVLPFLFVAFELTRAEAWPNKKIIQFLAFSVGIGAAAWCIFNIGAVLDLKDFLEFQALQTQMQGRAQSLGGAVSLAARRMISSEHGVGLGIFVLFVASPLFVRRRPFIVLWLATVFGTLALAMIIGPRLRHVIMLPGIALATCLVGVALGRWCSVGSPKVRILGWGATALLFLLVGKATLARVVDLVSPSSSERASEVVREISEQDTRILSSVELTLKPSAEALMDEHLRHERLGRKYDVEIPTQAQERKQVGEGYYITKMPSAIGGLEFATDKETKHIKAFAWPIQDEEWHLDYWLSRGYTVFVVSDEAFFIESDVPAYARMHREIRDRCNLLADLPDMREHIDWDRDVKVYQCTDSIL